MFLSWISQAQKCSRTPIARYQRLQLNYVLLKRAPLFVTSSGLKDLKKHSVTSPALSPSMTRSLSTKAASKFTQPRTGGQAYDAISFRAGEEPWLVHFDAARGWMHFCDAPFLPGSFMGWHPQFFKLAIVPSASSGGWSAQHARGPHHDSRLGACNLATLHCHRLHTYRSGKGADACSAKVDRCGSSNTA